MCIFVHTFDYPSFLYISFYQTILFRDFLSCFYVFWYFFSVICSWSLCLACWFRVLNFLVFYIKNYKPSSWTKNIIISNIRFYWLKKIIIDNLLSCKRHQTQLTKEKNDSDLNSQNLLHKIHLKNYFVDQWMRKSHKIILKYIFCEYLHLNKNLFKIMRKILLWLVN